MTVVVNPNQIKFVTDNIGAYSFENEDVSFSITPQMDFDFCKVYEESDTEIAAELVKQVAKLAMPNTNVEDENGEPMVVNANADALCGLSDFHHRFRND